MNRGLRRYRKFRQKIRAVNKAEPYWKLSAANMADTLAWYKARWPNNAKHKYKAAKLDFKKRLEDVQQDGTTAT